MGQCAAKQRRLAAEKASQEAADRRRLAAGLRRSGLPDALPAGSSSISKTDSNPAGSEIYAALSGHGGHGGYGYGYVHEEECPEGIDEDLALLITGAAIAAGAFVVYREITLRIKRKKRSDGDDVMSMMIGNVFAGRCINLYFEATNEF